MRALVAYSASAPKLKPLAQAVAKGIERKGHQVDLVEAKAGERATSVGMYEIIVAGSPSLGFWGGKIADDIAGYLAKTSRLEGRKAAVFVPAGGIGAGKSLTALMKVLEAQGAIIIDFASLGSQAAAEAFGAKLLG